MKLSSKLIVEIQEEIKKMDKLKHLEKHKLLHKYFDELMADYINHTERLPSEATLMDLAKWAHEQTINPTE